MSETFMDGKRLFDFLNLLGRGTQADVLREQTIDHFFRYGDLSSHMPMRYRRSDNRSYPVGRTSENYSGNLYFVGREYVEFEEPDGFGTVGLHSLYVLAVLKEKEVSLPKKRIRLLSVDNKGDFSIDFPDGHGFNGMFYVPRE